VTIVYRGHTICDSNDSGGKAGAGCNKTMSLQVRSDDRTFFRYVRYKVGVKGARAAAIEKAKTLINKHLEK